MQTNEFFGLLLKSVNEKICGLAKMLHFNKCREHIRQVSSLCVAATRSFDGNFLVFFNFKNAINGEVRNLPR